MTSLPVGLRRPSPWRRWLKRSHGLVVAAATLLAVVALLSFKLAHGLGYYDVASTVSSSTALALAAIGETLVILVGGLDLSAGAVISLSNCLLAAHMTATPASMATWSL